MTITWAAEHYPSYRPLLWSAEVFDDLIGDAASFKPYGNNSENWPATPAFIPIGPRKPELDS